LMVGTVEPRKGHNQAIDALELLWERDVNVALVVVGKPGWMVETLCQRMRDHPERGRRLHWLEQADDTVLAQLYRHCTGLLAASTAEGFGLPLIEAAHFGLPIVARALPVFKEVAGDHAFYFEGSDPQALARALDKWLELHGNGQAPSSREMTWQTWETSAAQLLEAVL
jgi:glycosyltransferase involved in cell wall biosynthesis